MINVVLLCEFGASTSLVAEKIHEAAEKRNIEAVVEAYSISDAGKVVPTADVVLLGPQVRFQAKHLVKEYADLGIPFVAMNPMDYGRLNGEGILDAALNAMKFDEKGE